MKTVGNKKQLRHDLRPVPESDYPTESSASSESELDLYNGEVTPSTPGGLEEDTTETKTQSTQTPFWIRAVRGARNLQD